MKPTFYYLCLVFLVSFSAAHGGVVLTVAESADGNDLSVTISGQIDTTGLSLSLNSASGSGVRGDNTAGGSLFRLRSVGGTLTDKAAFTTIVPPFGNTVDFGGATVSSQVGSAIGIGWNTNEFHLPRDYVSNASLAGSAIMSDLNFTKIGVTAGTSVSGLLVNNETVTLNFVSVPEPSSFGFLGMVGLLVAGFRRFRSAPWRDEQVCI